MAKGKHADEATKFLAYFTSPTNSKKLAQFFPPPRTSQLNAQTLAATNKLLSEDQIKNVVIDAFDGAVTKPSHTNSAEIAAKVKTALDPMWKADANVKSVLSGVCSAIKPMLAG
jgi:multiple sugar transport system substrate-binding protein